MKNSISVTFKNSHGVALDARLDRPLIKEPLAYAVFAHCFTCNKNFKAVRQISHALTKMGIAVLSFDFMGLGKSEGEFVNSHFSQNVLDLIFAAKYLDEQFDAPQLLIGHSLGGAAVLYAASQIPSVRAVATIGSPSSVKHVKHIFESELKRIVEEGMATVNIAGQKLEVDKAFLADLEKQDLGERVSSLRKALLIMHSPQDKIVPIEHAAKLYSMAFHPKSFVSLDDADHILRRSKDGLYAGEVIASWARRYLEYEEVESLKTEAQVGVRLLAEDSFTADIQARHHSWLGDEPTSVGGADLGPSPYELLQSALGACTAMTLQMYAKRKKWPLESVLVTLNFNKQHAKDGEQFDSQDAYIHNFNLELLLEGPLDDKQKARLLEIAHKCPVHRTLTGNKEIKIQLV